MTTKLPCGCKHDSQQWLSECEQHKREGDELHARAARERQPQQKPEGEFWT